MAVSSPSAVLAGWLHSLSAYAPALDREQRRQCGSHLPRERPHRASNSPMSRAPPTIEDGVALTAAIAAAVAAAPSSTTAETAAPDAPAPVQLASADPTDMLPAETPPLPRFRLNLLPVSGEAAPAQEPAIKLASADPGDDRAIATRFPPATITTGPASVASKASPSADTVAVLDECFVMDACIDRYLWALYQRTAKEDSIKVQERRAVTVKRKGQDGHGDAQLHQAGRRGLRLEGSEGGRAVPARR